MQLNPVQSSQPLPPTERSVCATETCAAFLQTLEQRGEYEETETVTPENEAEIEPELDTEDCNALVDGSVQLLPIRQIRSGSATDALEIRKLDFDQGEAGKDVSVKTETNLPQNDQKIVDSIEQKTNLDTLTNTQNRPEIGGHIQPERPMARPDLVPKMIANPTEAQVVKQVLSAPLADGNITEIALDPEELGRVRMQMITHEASVQIVIAVERPETADLMRKHLDLLTNDFKDLGYGDVNLEFASHDDSGNSRQSTSHSKAESDDPEIIQPVLHHSDGRVDIRL